MLDHGADVGEHEYLYGLGVFHHIVFSDFLSYDFKVMDCNSYTLLLFINEEDII